MPSPLRRLPGLVSAVVIAMFSLAGSALAQDPATAGAAAAAPAFTLDGGNTAWMLVSTALVLFMMIPGLAMFYAGLVRSRNVLSVLMQCFVLTAVLSVVWVVLGYSLTFSGSEGLFGNLDKAFLRGVTRQSFHPLSGPTGVPEIVFFAYQMMFFVITPGLMIGALVERVKFSALLVFSVLWNLLVYVPVAYGVWNTGNFFGIQASADGSTAGAIDHAGGIVIHITAGVSALVACIVLGPRRDHGKIPIMPHNLPTTVIGAAMLWVGWFGFNAGSNLEASGNSGMTLVVTHLSASVATLVWISIEWLLHRRPSMLGAATGSIAGLAAITPAASSVGPAGAMIIGAVSAVLCWFLSVKVKAKFNYDDSLDVFGVHGIGGIVGTLLLGVLGHESFGGYRNDASLTNQLLATLYTVGWSVLVTAVLLLALKKTLGFRVDEQAEREGLDSTTHGESAYND